MSLFGNQAGGLSLQRGTTVPGGTTSQPTQSLFGGQTTTQGTGTSSLFSNPTGGQGTTSLFSQGQQQNPAGTSLFPNTSGGGSLFQGGAGQSTGGLFQQPQAGGSTLNIGGGQGSLFGGQQQQQQQKPSLFPQQFGGQQQQFQQPGMQFGSQLIQPLFGGGGQPGSFGGQQQWQMPQRYASQMRKDLKLQVEQGGNRPLRDLSGKYPGCCQIIDQQISKGWTLLEEVEKTSQHIQENLKKIREEVLNQIQDAKLFKVRLTKANEFISKAREEFNWYYREACEVARKIENISFSRNTVLQVPSEFVVEITEATSRLLMTLAEEVREIELLIQIKLTNNKEETPEDVYEYIILIIEELYTFFMDVSNKVFKVDSMYKDFRKRLLEFLEERKDDDLSKKLNEYQQNIEKEAQILVRLDNLTNELNESEKLHK